MKGDPLHDLKETIGEHHGKLRDLENKVGEHSVQSVVDRVGKVEENLGTTGTRLDSQSADIANLRLDIIALNRKVRLSAGLSRPDFATWQPDITLEMIELIRAGLVAAPVPEAKVQQLWTKLQQAQEEVARWDRSRQAAILAVRALCELPQTAERAWRKEERTWSAFHAGSPRPAGDEVLARRLYNEAVHAQRSKKAALDLSKEADDAACATIRRRVQDAVAQDLVLPHWCDIALGLFSPAKPDRIEPWLDAATKLIRYRLLADIQDSLHAYGDRPSDETLAAEHDRVVQRCSDVRR